MKVLCPEPDSFSELGISALRRLFRVEAKSLTQKEFEELAPNFEILLIRFNTLINEKVLNDKSKVKYILSPTTGLDHIDFSLVEKFNIKVFHLKGQKRFLKKISGTAELTIGLLISISRKIPQSFSSVKKGLWEPYSYRGNELFEKKIGIIGLGRLGRKVAKVCNAFGMEVYGFDPYLKQRPASVKICNKLEDILKNSDYVSLHLPLNKQTKHLITIQEMQKMKENAFLINTSRGSIIKTEDLIYALKNRIIKGAALDVVEDEWSILKGIESKIISYARNNENLILTPHIGGATFESVERTDLFIIERFFSSIDKEKFL